MSEKEIPCPLCSCPTTFLAMNLATGTVIRRCTEGHAWAALNRRWERLPELEETE